jgi:hypothetical protein
VLVGGCVVTRFKDVPQYVRAADRETARDDAPALNGVKPRASRDPRFIKRRRKKLPGEN